MAYARGVKPHIVTRKRRGVDTDVQEGWEGALLPFDLVQHVLLPSEAAAIDKKNERMNAIYEQIRIVFSRGGEPDFTHLPDGDEAKAKFAKLFHDYNEVFAAAKIQGFAWDVAEYPGGESMGSHQGRPRLTSPHHGCVLARYGFVRTNRRPSGLPVRIILPSLTLGGGRAARLARSRPEGEGPIRLLRIGPKNRPRRATLQPATVIVHGPLGNAGELPRQREREAHG